MRYFYLLFIFTFNVNFSQADFVDDKYLEDQIYFGLNYNSLANTPLNFKQNKFSNSLNFGFIRDMPLNKRRNFGLGLGLGLSFSSVNSNMVFSQNDELFTVNLVENNSFLKNNLNTTKIEILTKAQKFDEALGLSNRFLEISPKNYPLTITKSKLLLEMIDFLNLKRFLEIF